MDIKEVQDAVKGAIDTHLDEVLEKKIGEAVGRETAKASSDIVKMLRKERAAFGVDRTGLDDQTKKDFAEEVKATMFGVRSKANEEIVSEIDARGGYLIPAEVANAIVRIAASTGLVMSQATRWNMGTDQLDIPAYTGSFLEGDYLGVNAAGGITAVPFGTKSLIVKKWQLAFAVGNDVLADANVNLADWLMALAGEALANMVDKQGLAGTGAPFVGILNHDDVTVHTMASGKTTFGSFDIDEASEMIGSVEESVLNGAGFVMNRSVWAQVRVQKDGDNYILPMAGAPSTAMLSNFAGVVGGARPVGEILGYPVFTSRHMPSTSAVSTKFAAFGNMAAIAYGDRGEMTFEQHNSGTYGSKEISLADQRGMVFKNRHALVLSLPAALVAARTAAS